ncbi:MAG: Gfo/Idh/MocA family oxidoreductase [Tissierellales bacterium]|nr:Gfo/Idh/MocA family oxidoreductase [Tissierellales bacterium]
MIRVGVIGCGKIAQIRHIPEYLDNDKVKLVGLYDRTLERAKALTEKYNLIHYIDYHDMLNDDNIDAVSICVSNNLHAEITIEALNHGKHVLCEKPMATNLEDCLLMLKTAKENNKKLLIAHNQRLTKAHVYAKKLIEDQILGDCLTFRTTFGHSGPETWSINPGLNTWFFNKDTASMGALGDLGIHKTDLINYILNDEIIEVKASLETLDKKYESGEPVLVDDNAICIYKTRKGAIGTMSASWTFYGPEDNSTVIYGTKGIMKIYDDERYSIRVFLRNGEKINFDLEGIQTNDNQTKSGVIDEFVDCLEHNKDSVLSAEHIIPSMKAIFASLNSALTGKTIRID